MTAEIKLGLRENWQQFTMLVVVNAFVGAMVGLERTVLPVIATTDFRIASATAVLSFIAMFGLTKALTNLLTGWLVERRSRRWVLLLGWFVALPVPLLILEARSWWWIVGANALLGVNQGLAWSTTIIMKIDLVGPRRRGLAMGLNEFAGYVAVGMAGLLAGFLAARYGLRAGAGYPGLVIATVGLALSWFVRDTRAHALVESSHERWAQTAEKHQPVMAILKRSLWSDAGLFSVSQAGLVNNLNDGLAWGVFPLLFVASGLSLRETSILAAVYPIVWGLGQLVTGALSDRWGRKRPIVAGMVLQGVALVGLTLFRGFDAWLTGLVLLGAGTALVYPTLLAAIGDVAHPAARAATVGVYRLWRDLGYVAGALLAGVLVDAFGMFPAIRAIGALTAASGMVVALRFKDTRVHLETQMSGAKQ